MTLLAARAEYERMLREIRAELYTHSNESLDEVIRRTARERPETPHQVRLKQKHDADVAEIRRLDLIAQRAIEQREQKAGK